MRKSLKISGSTQIARGRAGGCARAKAATFRGVESETGRGRPLIHSSRREKEARRGASGAWTRKRPADAPEQVCGAVKCPKAQRRRRLTYCQRRLRRFGARKTRPSGRLIRSSHALTRWRSRLTRPSQRLTRPSDPLTRWSRRLTRPGKRLTRRSDPLTRPRSSLTRPSRRVASPSNGWTGSNSALTHWREPASRTARGGQRQHQRIRRLLTGRRRTPARPRGRGTRGARRVGATIGRPAFRKIR